MDIQEQIRNYISGLPLPKQADMLQLHRLVLQVSPACKLWFSDGTNSQNKIVANPTIGYGFFTMRYAKGNTRDCFQIGISANNTGISVYILGISDKTYLARIFGEKIGKAVVTGYCIKFKTLKDINMNVLEDVIQFGFGNGLNKINS
jgi:hypothetical protein